MQGISVKTRKISLERVKKSRLSEGNIETSLILTTKKVKSFCLSPPLSPVSVAAVPSSTPNLFPPRTFFVPSRCRRRRSLLLFVK